MAANRLTEEAIAFAEYAERAGKGLLMERFRRQKEPRDILRMDKIFAPATEATISRVPNRRGVMEIAAQQDPRPEILGLFTATDAWAKAMQRGEYKTDDEEHQQPKR